MCTFTVDYEGHPRAILDEARKLIEKDGGTLATSDTHAWFTVRTPVGKVVGVCELTESSGIKVTIAKKPRFVPCFAVEERMNAAFAIAAKAAELASR